MKKPNFFVAGAFKGGTTTIYHHLKQHPDIFMCTPKEPRYFAYDPGNKTHVTADLSSYPIRTESQYLALFAGATSESAIGEASPIYLNSDIAAARISKFRPDAKIIISLRDPIARALSGYQMHVRSGKESRGVDEALLPGERWVDGSVYADNLERFYSHFDTGQIKAVLLENMSNATFIELFEFLGVDKSFEPDTYEVLNAGGMPRSRFVQHLLTAAKRRARTNRSLSKLVPNWAREAYRAAQARNSYKPKLSADRERLLAQYFVEDAGRVKEITGLDTGIWRLSERAYRTG